MEKNENIASDLISAVLSMRGIRSDHLEPNLAFFKEQMNDNIGNISDGNNSSGKLSLLNENLLLFVDNLGSALLLAIRLCFALLDRHL